MKEHCYAVGNNIFMMVNNNLFPVGLFTFILIMNGVDIFDYAAGAITSLIFLPQVIKTGIEKSTRDIHEECF